MFEWIFFLGVASLFVINQSNVKFAARFLLAANLSSVIVPHYLAQDLQNTLNPIDFSTISICVCAFVYQLKKRANFSVPTEKSEVKWLPMLILVFVLFIIVGFSYAVTGSGSVLSLINQVLAPLVGALALSDAVGRHFISAKEVALWLAVVSASQALLATGQVVFDRNLIFERQQLLATTWLNPDDYARAFGTTSHPLVLALLLVATQAVIMRHYRNGIGSYFALLMFVGILFTQSRTGIILSGFLLLILLIRNLKRITLVVPLVLITIAVSGLAFFQEIFLGISQKFVNDWGSSSARLEAFQFVSDNWLNFIFTGGGYTASYSTKQESKLQSSFENGYLMWFFDFGILTTVVFMFSIWFLLGSPKIGFYAFITLIMVGSFSSIAAPGGSLSILLLSLIALTQSAIPEKGIQVQTASPVQSASP
jgi:hypothetical protein